MNLVIWVIWSSDHWMDHWCLDWLDQLIDGLIAPFQCINQMTK